MAILLTKQLALAEDIEFGMGVTAQERGGNQFNAAFLPYSLTETVAVALDNRYTSVYIEANFAAKTGDELLTFKVKDGVLASEAVNLGQLDLKETKAVVATKANKQGDSTLTFEAAAGVLNTDVVNLLQVTTKLDLKTDKTYTDAQLALKADKTNVLELDNQDQFTPLQDYNPATKKFVDDSIYTAFQTGVNGSFTAASGETITVNNGLIVGII